MTDGFAGFFPWLFPLRGLTYDALHRFVGPDGYRLSDRIWRADAKTRNMIDNLLAHEILQGTSAVNIAAKLEQFLQQERAGVTTRAPYGRWGSYDARRLARTEITAAWGRTVIGAALRNPLVPAIQWSLSPNRSADWPCNCEDNATRDQGMGAGVYDKYDIPSYPDHPHCMCTLSPVVAASTAEVVADLRAWLDGEPAPSGTDYGRLFDYSGFVVELLRLWGMSQV